jgi:DNA-binding transcriptional LysR family regulator
VHRAVLAGPGIALIPHLLACDDVRAGRLVKVMLDYPPRRVPLSIVYPSRRNLPPRTRAVMDFIAELVHADPAMHDDGES